ncbi:hypothetical protein XELAEV_18025406mg [Xenopus laevis]|uniref:Uncharacterized protein n=1 Tax=Xenopus laevis TaxID=8355 RepID=A0A974D269_XENLA|nr:hypothetical protein XELAEV_18025406mg [Xenopus laevis]
MSYTDGSHAMCCNYQLLKAVMTRVRLTKLIRASLCWQAQEYKFDTLDSKEFVLRGIRTAGNHINTYCSYMHIYLCFTK